MDSYFIQRLQLLLEAFSVIADAIEQGKPVQPEELKALRHHIAKTEQYLTLMESEAE
ncbi:hypothetical protein D3C86_1502800 [compost metagenome]|jgi:hypothetical protein